MIKLYKYRPLSEFLFKELYYNEIYFATYIELNDPLDLSVRIDFRPKNEHQLIYLVYSIIKSSSLLDFKKSQILIEFYQNDELRSKFCNELYNSIIDSKSEDDFISYDLIEEHIKVLSEKFNLDFRLPEFKKEIQRLTKVFFENSCATCFSETHTDFLMWSHYASKHSGICMEFSLDHQGQFPYIFTEKRKPNKDKYLKDYHTVLTYKEHIYWEEIKKIKYHKKPPSIKFYDFWPVFENENDIDLMNISKGRWHGYAAELKKIFSVKTFPWKYEKEWRAIEINFGKMKKPEERLRHYPIEALTGIYFGLRTPEITKQRIYNIFKSKRAEIKYFDSHLTNDRDLKFNEWEYYEE